MLRGSFGFGSINKNNTPEITLYKFKTGFQSALKIFKQTLPSKSILGWYIFVIKPTEGDLYGYYSGKHIPILLKLKID